MSDPLFRNLTLYVLSILAGSLAAGLVALSAQLSGTDPINWRPIATAVIGPIVTGLLATRLARPEGAQLAHDIDALKARGIQRRDMVVVTQEEAEVGIANAPPADEGRMPPQ